MTYVYSCTVPISNPEQLVVDFFHSTGYQTNNVSNLVYFQVWTNAQRTETLDVTGITIRQRRVATSAASETVLYNGTISTIAKGKGSFEYVPLATAGLPILELPVGQSIVRRSVSFTPSSY